MPHAVSGIDRALDYTEFTKRFRVGPCGVYAAVRREHGWGQVAFCEARAPGDVESMPFGHYVIVTDSHDIIDLTNCMAEELEYIDVERLAPDEMPDWVDIDMLRWMRECLGKHKTAPVHLMGSGFQGAVDT